MFWMLKSTHNRIVLGYEAEISMHRGVAASQREQILCLERALAEARKNDGRDAKGRYSGAKKPATKKGKK